MADDRSLLSKYGSVPKNERPVAADEAFLSDVSFSVDHAKAVAMAAVALGVLKAVRQSVGVGEASGGGSGQEPPQSAFCPGAGRVHGPA
jgi:hypothetical protein